MPESMTPTLTPLPVRPSCERALFTPVCMIAVAMSSEVTPSVSALGGASIATTGYTAFTPGTLRSKATSRALATCTEKPFQSVSYAKRSLRSTPVAFAAARNAFFSFASWLAEPPAERGLPSSCTNQREGVSL